MQPNPLFQDHTFQKALAILYPSFDLASTNESTAKRDYAKALEEFKKDKGISSSDLQLTAEEEYELIWKALNEDLKAQGHKSSEKAYKLKGSVLNRNNKPEGSIGLIALDADLSGINIFKSAKTVKSLYESEGFDYLGEATSAKDGSFEITFYEWQYASAERKQADVVVFAIDEQENIIGRSELYNSEDYLKSREIKNADVLLENTDDTVEYDIVAPGVEGFIAESNAQIKSAKNRVSLHQIAQNSDQINFIASELSLEASHIEVLSLAHKMVVEIDDSLERELLYGIGRHGIGLNINALFKKSSEDLRATIDKSIEKKIINKFSKRKVKTFLNQIEKLVTENVLSEQNGQLSSINKRISLSLKNKKQKEAFLKAHREFKGKKIRDFWQKTLPSLSEFKGKQKLIDDMLFTQRCIALCNGDDAMVSALRKNKIDTVDDLMSVTSDEWSAFFAGSDMYAALKKQGKSKKELEQLSVLQAAAYEANLNSAFPTKKIRNMLNESGIPVNKKVVGRKIKTFLDKNPKFQFESSRVHNFEKEISAAGGDHAGEVKDEMLKIQRVLQVSPSPESMSVLMEKNLLSATQIARMPEKSFINRYAKDLGGEEVTKKVFSRAKTIATRNEMIVNRIASERKAMSAMIKNPSKEADLEELLKVNIPNFSELFGARGMCECDHCSSIYSAAAYFVNLMVFLRDTELNHEEKSPLDILELRRPDLRHLELTCENINTLVPYIDMANEIMESYLLNLELDSSGKEWENFEGYNTGKVDADDIRANPQNTQRLAYKYLKDQVFPFQMPYHRPLDILRIYCDHLSISFHEMMSSVRAQPLYDEHGNILADGETIKANALAAESLRLSPEKFRVLTGQTFGESAAAPSRAAFEFWGLSSDTELENLSVVPDVLKQSGLKYSELIDVLKSKYINPAVECLGLFNELLRFSGMENLSFYRLLNRISGGVTGGPGYNTLLAARRTYEEEYGVKLDQTSLNKYLVDHFDAFKSLITLYSESDCDLDSTWMVSIERIYENGLAEDIADLEEDENGPIESGIDLDHMNKMHRFIRLKSILDWDFSDVDIMLCALGIDQIDATGIRHIAAFKELVDTSGRSVQELATLFGSINTWGENSLYDSLFLNASIDPVGDVFKEVNLAYLESTGKSIEDHVSTIISAFGISEDELHSILEVAVIDDGGQKKLELSDELDLGTLSTLYRHVALARALNCSVSELISILILFENEGSYPFSVYELGSTDWLDIDPFSTLDFYQFAITILDSDFSMDELSYILADKENEETLELSETLSTLLSIRSEFNTIDTAYPVESETPLTIESVSNLLRLTFAEDTVTSFIEIFGHYTKADLDDSAIAILPEHQDWILEVMSSFISDASEILNSESSEEDRLMVVYSNYLPLLKSKLQTETTYSNLASLFGISDESTAVLAASSIEALKTGLNAKGVSTSYFTDSAFTNPLAAGSGVVQLEGDNDLLSARDSTAMSGIIRSFARVSANDEYTIYLEKGDADDTVELYIDGEKKTLTDEGSAGPLLKADPIALDSTEVYDLRINFVKTGSGDSSLKLQLKTATSAKSDWSSDLLIPNETALNFYDGIAPLHKAAMFTSGHGLGDPEVSHFVKYSSDFGSMDLLDLTPQDWKTVSDYMRLRTVMPQKSAFLTDVFEQANIIMSNSELTEGEGLAELLEILSAASGWSEEYLNQIINVPSNWSIADLKNHEKLIPLIDVFRIINAVGISYQTLVELGSSKAEIEHLEGFEEFEAKSDLIKEVVRSRYGDQNWSEVASKLSDELRANQQEALVQYLLTMKSIRDEELESADDLFEYFLIDVQMDPCMDTSRIVQANTSIQMFVNRCLLNLESITDDDGNQFGVAPKQIDKERWEWMKFYRVWETNVKTFTYPENWLEPEWRSDRSEIFKELESYLTQNDVTNDTAEEAIRNYLKGMAEVSNLEVCGFCSEEIDSSAGCTSYDRLHVFARTPSAPYSYYYRQRTEFGKWTAWETVPLDIKSVEDGENSGVHLIPVIWKDKLVLFWPEFVEKAGDASTSIEAIGDMSSADVAGLAPSKKWEVRLGFSEYSKGSWMPKLLTNEYITIEESLTLRTEGLSKTFFATKKLNNALILFSFDSYYPIEGRRGIQPRYGYWGFKFHDYNAPLNVITYEPLRKNQTTTLDYFAVTNFFESQHSLKDSPLVIEDDTYLEESVDFKLLTTNNRYKPDQVLYSEFFATVSRSGTSDSRNSFFVQVEDITLVDVIRFPHESDFNIYSAFELTNYQIPEFLSPQHQGVPELHHEIDVNHYMLLNPPFDPELNPVPLLLVRDRSFGASSFFPDLDDIRMIPFEPREDTGLIFNTFYHPLVNQLTSNLHVGGLDALFESDDQPSFWGTEDDNGNNFSKFKPSTSILVQNHEDYPNRTMYKENICFDVNGANVLYNYELFFHVPLYIATRLSRNGQYEKAMNWFHYIFEPSTDEKPFGTDGTEHYWKFAPFRESNIVESMETYFRALNAETAGELSGDECASQYILQIEEWLSNPFNTHLVASNRPSAYMQHVVIKYVENIIAWADSLFRQFTRETVMESLQLYVIANKILGPYPEFIPKRGNTAIETFESIEPKLDAFGNALVDLENAFPYTSDISAGSSSVNPSLLGYGESLYFCIPSNDKLLDLWDTVADRLFKIRHCQNIEGVEMPLALFAPPIDPAVLVAAFAQGLSLGSVLSDLSSPPPIYRFTYLIQKANEFCNDVKSLGSSLLSAIEKRDSEELSLLRACHESVMLELLSQVKERQVLEAKANRENLEKSRETTILRLRHYLTLLDKEDLSIPQMPELDSELDSSSSLPADSSVEILESAADIAIESNQDTSVLMLSEEISEIKKTKAANTWSDLAGASETAASLMHVFPEFEIAGMPMGVGTGASTGGGNFGSAASALGSFFRLVAQRLNSEAGMAGRLAGHKRRELDMVLQANSIAREIVSIDKQLVSADIRIQITEKELENHYKQIERSEEIEQFLTDKFTNEELYAWMKEQLFSVYKQSYNLAYDLAKKAEKAYKYDLGLEMSSYIQYGYWDNSKQGLVAGEKLQLSLRQLEKAYIEQNSRELEIRKSISLVNLDPKALIKFKEKGKCQFYIPEEIFDLDFQSHYFRRIKTINVSIPSIVGPYTSVPVTLRLLSNHVRIKNTVSSGYVASPSHAEDERFRSSNVLVSSRALSNAQNDSGMFQFDFNDARYLPFEGAGVISSWEIDLGEDDALRQFDFSTINDVIIQLSYTARETSGVFIEKVRNHLKDNYLKQEITTDGRQLAKMFNVRQDFPSEFYQYSKQTWEDSPKMNIEISSTLFPTIAQNSNLIVSSVEVYVKKYNDSISLTNCHFNGVSKTLAESHHSLLRSALYENELSLDGPSEMSIKLEISTTSFESISASIKDIFLIFNYKIEPDS